MGISDGKNRKRKCRLAFCFQFFVHKIRSLAEYSAAIEALKQQIKALREQKADCSWVLQELAFKVDSTVLDDYVTQEEIDDCLDDFSRILMELQDVQV